MPGAILHAQNAADDEFESGSIYRKREDDMDTLKHGMNGYRIPAYMEEILTHNYCPFFMRMSIVRDGDSYKFAYRPGKLTRLRAEGLGLYDKLMLLRSVIILSEAAESYLIKTENYLLEPELIYTDGKGFLPGNIRLLFYPDIRRLRLSQKLMLFADRIKGGSRDEKDVLNQLRDILESGDINRARLFLDKHILRIESRMYSNAG